MSKEHIEPLLKENKDKFVIFPVKHNDIWDFYQKIKSCFWTAEEIDLRQDIHDWNNKLSADERYFIKHLLAFSAASNGIVARNFTENFLNEIQYSETRFFYGFQLMKENIHAETNSLIIDTYVKDNKEKEKLFIAAETFPANQRKAQWLSNWINSDSFAERLIAFAAVADIFFSGKFCTIFWLHKRGLMPGLSFSTELISRDKTLYSDFAVHLHNNHLLNNVPKKRIREIILDALEIEQEFITEALPESLIGLNKELMKQYLEFVSDGLLTKLNCEKEFGSANPFGFIDWFRSEGKTNILEKRVGEFQKAGERNKEKDSHNINFDSHFK